MSPEHLSQTASTTEAFEPRVTSDPVPVWLFVLLFILLYVGMFYFDQHSGWFNPRVYSPFRSVAELQTYQPPSGAGNLERGKVVFDNVCALCHNNDGGGKPGQGPPLAGSEWVLGSHERLIRIPLNGLTGPIEVKGQPYNLSMLAMGASLSDEDLAATLSYMRQSWGNKAPVITPAHVKAVRAAIGNRPQPWTVPELMKIQ